MSIIVSNTNNINNTISISSSNNSQNILLENLTPSTNKIGVSPIFSTKGDSSFYIVCEDITERDNISSDKRGLGLIAYVISNDNLYQLQGGLSNDSWKLLTKPYVSVGMFNPPENALDGTLYFDLTENKLKVYMLSNWYEVPSLNTVTSLISEHDNDINAHKSLFDVSKNYWKSII